LSKTVEKEFVKELRDGLALLIYDIPYPPRNGDRKALSPWFSWYGWSTYRLRSLGYPVQYSVVLIDESRIEAVLETIERIEQKRANLMKSFNLYIPEPRVNIVRFSLKTREDAEALLSVIVEGLKSTLSAFVNDVEKSLREGRDRTRLQQRVKGFVKRIVGEPMLLLYLLSSSFPIVLESKVEVAIIGYIAVLEHVSTVSTHYETIPIPKQDKCLRKLDIS